MIHLHTMTHMLDYLQVQNQATFGFYSISKSRSQIYSLQKIGRLSGLNVSDSCGFHLGPSATRKILYREEKFDSIALTEDSMTLKLLKEYWYDVVQIPVATIYSTTKNRSCVFLLQTLPKEHWHRF
jgi:hypothetical protein